MPPPDAIRQLTAAERDIIKRWLEQGGKYQKHWALEPIQSPTVPAASQAQVAWGKNEVDRFLLPRITAAGLAPQPEADRRTLIRRVAFTLTACLPKSMK